MCDRATPLRAGRTPGGAANAGGGSIKRTHQRSGSFRAYALRRRLLSRGLPRGLGGCWLGPRCGGLRRAPASQPVQLIGATLGEPRINAIVRVVDGGDRRVRANRSADLPPALRERREVA